MSRSFGSDAFREFRRFFVAGVVMLAIASVLVLITPMMLSADAPSWLRWLGLAGPIVLGILTITGCGCLIAAGAKLLSGLRSSGRL